MKIYLDDSRVTPPGWHRTYWPDEVINLLLNESVEEISLDHDLGDDERGTGYDVLLWIEEQVHEHKDWACPKISIHSANSSAVEKMNAAREAIYKQVERNKD